MMKSCPPVVTKLGNFEIVTKNEKYGIVDNNGKQVVDFIFDDIFWHIEERLVEFHYNRKYAICKLSDLQDF